MLCSHPLHAQPIPSLMSHTWVTGDYLSYMHNLCSKVCWLSTQGTHAMVLLAWKMIWFSLLTSNQYTRNQKQINKYTTYTVFTYIITWPKTGTFGIHNTYMISELNYRLSWDAMTTKWSSGFRLYMIMNDTVDWSPNSVTVQYEWVLWEDMLHWNTSSATVLISYLK